MSSSTKTYDVVVVGGGIHGVGIAQAAAAAGYSVLVLEQKALAHGTSSKLLPKRTRKAWTSNLQLKDS